MLPDNARRIADTFRGCTDKRGRMVFLFLGDRDLTLATIRYTSSSRTCSTPIAFMAAPPGSPRAA